MQLAHVRGRTHTQQCRRHLNAAVPAAVVANRQRNKTKENLYLIAMDRLDEKPIFFFSPLKMRDTITIEPSVHVRMCVRCARVGMDRCVVVGTTFIGFSEVRTMPSEHNGPRPIRYNGKLAGNVLRTVDEMIK